MTRAFYFVGGLVALMLAFAVQSVFLVSPPDARAAQAVAAHAASPVATDGIAVAIDDLAAWPVAARR